MDLSDLKNQAEEAIDRAKDQISDLTNSLTDDEPKEPEGDIPVDIQDMKEQAEEDKQTIEEATHQQ